jgi:hypothetical protein
MEEPNFPQRGEFMNILMNYPGLVLGVIMATGMVFYVIHSNRVFKQLDSERKTHNLRPK